MKNLFVLVLFLSAISVSAQEPFGFHVPEQISSTTGKYYEDLIGISQPPFDYKLNKTTIKFTARPVIFNHALMNETSPSDWDIEHKWTFKAIFDNGSDAKYVTSFDPVAVYDIIPGTKLLWVGYTATPIHKKGEHTAGYKFNCGFGISLAAWLHKQELLSHSNSEE